MATAATDADAAKPNVLLRYLPILGWMPRPERKWLTADAVAGLSVCALLVPPSLAYASLVGVPVQYGLYTAFAALLIQVASELRSHGASLALAQVHPSTLALWRRAGLIDVVGEGAIFASGRDAAAPSGRPTPASTNDDHAVGPS